MLQKREHYQKWNEHRLVFEDRSAELNLSHLPTDSGNFFVFILLLALGRLRVKTSENVL